MSDQHLLAEIKKAEEQAKQQTAQAERQAAETIAAAQRKAQELEEKELAAYRENIASFLNDEQAKVQKEAKAIEDIGRKDAAKTLERGKRNIRQAADLLLKRFEGILK